jgi:hypothetical protein
VDGERVPESVREIERETNRGALKFAIWVSSTNEHPDTISFVPGPSSLTTPVGSRGAAERRGAKRSGAKRSEAVRTGPARSGRSGAERVCWTLERPPPEANTPLGSW